MKTLLFALILATGCAAQGRVVRSYGGELSRGRAISAEAYAHYARGAVLEAQGSYEDAAAEYQAVLEFDRLSVSAWTKLGACLCAIGRPADEPFDQALRLGPRFAPAWHERALCLERRGAHAQAVVAAQRALSLEPNHFEHAETAARLLERVGDDARARRLLVAAVLWQPSSVDPRLALAAFALRKHDPVLLRMSCCLTTDPKPFPMALPPADALLPRSGSARRGDGAGARRASEQRMVERALCAAARGDGEAAVRTSSMILDTDADNADAWVALLYGADLLQDASTFGDALARIGLRPTLTYRLARELIAEVLARRSGEDAAAAWTRVWESAPPGQGGDAIDCQRRGSP